MDVTRTKFGFFFAVIAIIIASIYLQNNILLNWDISWLQHVSRRLWHGGKYYHDFFETNPPLILYLYLPPVFISDWLLLKITWVSKAYIFLLSLSSWLLCYHLTLNLFAKDLSLRLYFMLMLLIAFLILPSYEFGQREHLLVLLIIPYLLLSANRGQNSKISVRITLITAIMAGIGFSIKPYFLLALVANEILLICISRNYLQIMRLEIVVIVSIIISYALSIMWLQPEYLQLAVPFLLRNYYQGFGENFLILLLRVMVFNAGVGIAMYFIFIKDSPYKILGGVFATGVCAFLLAYFIQQTVWYYHILPAVVLSFLIMTLALYLFCQKTGRSSNLSSGLLIIVTLSLPSYIFYQTTHWALLYAKNQKPILHFLQQHADKQTVYFLSTTTTTQYPIIDYSNAITKSRLAFLNWLPGMQAQVQSLRGINQNNFINLIADEINTDQPKYIFVLSDKLLANLSNQPFSIVETFSHNKNFFSAWKNYHYDETLFTGQIKLLVYLRNGIHA
jgi:hypothetical protein